MACLANAFALLDEDSADMKRVVAVVEANEDAAAFLAAEKRRKVEAKDTERKKEEERQQRKKKWEERQQWKKKKEEERLQQEKKYLQDTLLNSVLAFPTYRRPTFTRRSNYPRYNHEQNQGQGQEVDATPVLTKIWVPKSELDSQSEQIQGTRKEEVENQIPSHQGHYQQRGFGAYQNRGIRTGSNSEQSIKKNAPELEKEKEAVAEKQQTKAEAGDGVEQSKKEEEGVDNNNGGDGSTKSVDGKTRKNMNGSLRKKLRKQKKAAGAEKEGEETNQGGDTSSVHSQSTTRVYTLEEYEKMKQKKEVKKGVHLKEKKDNGSNSAHHQPQQPKKVTIDVNGGQRFNNGGQRFNNGGRRYDNGGGRRFYKGDQRFNNGGGRVDNEQRYNNEGRRFNHGGQRSDNEDRRVPFNLENANEFLTLGKN